MGNDATMHKSDECLESGSESFEGDATENRCYQTENRHPKRKSFGYRQNQMNWLKLD